MKEMLLLLLLGVCTCPKKNQKPRLPRYYEDEKGEIKDCYDEIKKEGDPIVDQIQEIRKNIEDQRRQEVEDNLE